MNLANISLFRMLTARMRWLNERQAVIASNVANADTPNYQANDLKPLDFKSELQASQSRLKTQTTNAAHLRPARAGGEFENISLKGKANEITPTGNAVVIEDEMMKVAETVADYQLMTNLYTKHVAMLKSVLGRMR